RSGRGGELALLAGFLGAHRDRAARGRRFHGVNLGELRSPQLTDRAARTLLAVPLGATEQHGPHLPLSTDTVIATQLCRRLADRIPDVVVAPPIPYGSSGEHAGFAGTLSLGQAMLTGLVVELVRSADGLGGGVRAKEHCR